MKWPPNKPDRIIRGKERHRERLLSITPLLATLAGN
jgi:hypothetical protein